MNPIHVLLVNDSLLISRIIKKILTADPLFSPIDWVKDGVEAEAYVQNQTPDIILMDIHMPRQNGVETIRNILAKYQIPILVVTATITRNMTDVFQCLEYGALEAVKPPQHKDFQRIDSLPPEHIKQLGANFIDKVKTIATLKNKVSLSQHPPVPITEVRKIQEIPRPASRLIAIGASTGGPGALTQLLKNIPPDFPAAIVIVQHIDADFVQSLIGYLQQYAYLTVKEAIEGQVPKAGNVYLAGKKGEHLTFGLHKQFKYEKAIDLIHTPSINVLFESVAKSYQHRATGVLLTGMGDDGAKGLKQIRNSNGFTIAQDQESSIIYGMPRAAAQINACSEILPLTQIGARLVQHMKNRQAIPFGEKNNV